MSKLRTCGARKVNTNWDTFSMSQLFFSIMAAFFFTRNYEGKGIGEGVRFGLYVGLILGSGQLATQCVQESVRILGNCQVQMEADVGRACEVLKQRFEDLHTELVGEAPAGREFSHRLDRLEQEVAEIRQRLSSAV